jgi:hypothetical protein
VFYSMFCVTLNPPASIRRLRSASFTPAAASEKAFGWINKESELWIVFVTVSSAIRCACCFLSERVLPDWLTKSEEGFSIQYTEVLEFILATEFLRRDIFTRNLHCEVWVSYGNYTRNEKKKLEIRGNVLWSITAIVASTSASYSGGLWFKHEPGNRLSWLMFFVVFLSTSMQILGHELNLTTEAARFSETSVIVKRLHGATSQKTAIFISWIRSYSLPYHLMNLIIQLYNIWSQLLTLNMPQIK